MSDRPIQNPVLIVGAGPTGLVLALWLAKVGVRARIIDKTAEPGTSSRALAVQARTLEFYRQLGLADAVVERGHKVPTINLWVRSRRATRIAVDEIGRGLSPFSFLLIFPQDEHERLLIERLRDVGVEVERGTELMGVEAAAEGVRATLRRADGSTEHYAASYLAGCDGARSTVREQLGTQFPGGTYEHVFYVADVEASGPPMDGGLHVDLDSADFLAVFPLHDAGHARLIGSIQDARASQGGALQFSDIQSRALQNLKIEVRHVHWFSTYRVHHRVAQSFRQGRIFLLGDAAHIHSPVGGQGMNTGIGDAINLAWKLAAVLKQPASDWLLASYEPERMAFARQLVATTDRAFMGVINPSALARFVRTRLTPLLLPPLFKMSRTRRLLFRVVSQLGVNYRGSALSAGRARALRGGDRLPWVRSGADPHDNFEPLAALQWQLHVYGRAAPELTALAAGRDIALHEFAWQPAMSAAGLARDALYLIRPDGYIALADAQARLYVLTQYLEQHPGLGI